MAPTTFHLLKVSNTSSFLSTLRKVPHSDRPLYIGQCQHWIHAPSNLSVAALTGSGPELTAWTYLLIHKDASSSIHALPPGLAAHIDNHWSITASLPDEMLATYTAAQTKRSTTSSNPPSLPTGWSASDPSALAAASSPEDLEISLSTTSFPLGSNTTATQPLTIKDYILHDLGAKYEGPVSMLNLLSTHPSLRPQIHAYMSHFSTSLGPKYGAEAQVLGLDVTDWSSRESEGELTIQQAMDSEKGYGTVEGEAVGWEDVGLVWYPSIWHFGALLADPAYAEADGEFKQGVLRDGPILCCTEVEVGYED